MVAVTFNRIISAVTAERHAGQSAIERFGLAVVRLDLEHLGFGIARNATNADAPVTWTEGTTPATRILTLRSTLNNSNSSSIGWFTYNCIGGGTLSAKQVATGGTGLSNNIVLLDLNKNWLANAIRTTGSCPVGTTVVTGYPYDSTVTNGCTGSQFCNKIEYSLSTTQTLTTCAQGTRNLLRKVGNAAAGEPIQNCVADFLVRFDRDTDTNGTVELDNSTVLPGTTIGIMDQLRNVDMYILMQVGVRRTPNKPNFTGVTTLDGVTFTTSGVTDFNRYTWKVLKISGKPMSWK